MSEHENGNFVLKCGQNQQKYQSFMAISDFALLYRIRRCGARFQSLSSIKLLLRLWLQPLVSAGFQPVCRSTRWFHLERERITDSFRAFALTGGVAAHTIKTRKRGSE